MTTKPLINHSAAVDAMLDARKSVQTVQESDLPGGTVYVEAGQVLGCIDRLIANLRVAR